MANVIFATPNYADPGSLYTPTIAGGSWSASLPLSNLQDRRLAKVARSTNVLVASTQFEVALQVTRGVRVIAIPKHTMSITATIRVRASDTAGSYATPTYDTGWLDVFPVLYPSGSLNWGHPSFWGGRISAEDAAGYNNGFVHVTPTPQLAKYWFVEINDTANAAGYIDLARLFLASAYQPTINMEYGAKLGWESDTTRTETDGGAAIYNDRPRRRNFACVLGHLPADEALVNPFEMQRKLGTAGQLFFIFDPSDTAHMHRRAFLAVQRELSAIDFPYFARNSVPISLIEEL